MTQTENISLRKICAEDLPVLWDMAMVMGASKKDDYFDLSLEYQEKGERIVFIASFDGEDVGYCMLAWKPKYAFFQRFDIPEIQDLNVLPHFRRRGIAQVMMDACENLAREAGKEHMGIGVGMDVSYGPAQILYVSRGYVPDGNGLTYNRQPLARGEFRPVDDDLCLMLVKAL